jgi:hypothetical protein
MQGSSGWIFPYHGAMTVFKVVQLNTLLDTQTNRSCCLLVRSMLSPSSAWISQVSYTHCNIGSKSNLCSPCVCFGCARGGSKNGKISALGQWLNDWIGPNV